MGRADRDVQTLTASPIDRANSAALRRRCLFPPPQSSQSDQTEFRTAKTGLGEKSRNAGIVRQTARLRAPEGREERPNAGRLRAILPMYINVLNGWRRDGDSNHWYGSENNPRKCRQKMTSKCRNGRTEKFTSKMPRSVLGERCKMIQNPDHQFNYFYLFFNDLVAVEPVSCEPLSHRHFPCSAGINREFNKMSPSKQCNLASRTLKLCSFLSKFPTNRTGN